MGGQAFFSSSPAGCACASSAMTAGMPSHSFMASMTADFNSAVSLKVALLFISPMVKGILLLETLEAKYCSQFYLLSRATVSLAKHSSVPNAVFEIRLPFVEASPYYNVMGTLIFSASDVTKSIPEIMEEIEHMANSTAGI